MDDGGGGSQETEGNGIKQDEEEMSISVLEEGGETQEELPVVQKQTQNIKEHDEDAFWSRRREGRR